jgi:hypothetical protein
MVYFKTKNPNLGIFWGALEWTMLIYIFTAIWYDLLPLGIVCGNLVFFPFLVCLDQQKCGNPGQHWAIFQSKTSGHTECVTASRLTRHYLKH